MLIRLIEYQPFDPFFNMAVDEAISSLVRKDVVPPTLRLYGWEKKAITLGEFQKLDEVNYEACLQMKIDIVRRPTGGKGILHYNDLTYSFSAKKEGRFRGNLFQNYETLSQIFAKAFMLTGISVEIKREKRGYNKSSLCFALSSFGEICFKGVKIIGSAQKRWTDGFLQQGTIPITVNRELLKAVFKGSPSEVDKIFGIEELCDNFDISVFQRNIKLALKEEGFDFEVGSLTDEELALAVKFLQERYYQKVLSPHFF